MITEFLANTHSDQLISINIQNRSGKKREKKENMKMKKTEFLFQTRMEFIKRLLGFHKTPPVLVDACLFELNCIITHITPKYGRRV